MTISNKKVIIQVITSGKNFSRINYSRRMYAVMRRYTPDVVEGEMNECLADITGLRTFYKMTYKEIVQKILNDLKSEIGIPFTVRVTTVKAFEEAKNKGKKSKSISTYKELNKLFSGLSFVKTNTSRVLLMKKKLVVPFLGKVS